MPVVHSVRVSPEDLVSLKCLMAKYRSFVCRNLVPHSSGEAEVMLSNICTKLDTYLSEALQPVDAILRYVIANTLSD